MAASWPSRTSWQASSATCFWAPCKPRSLMTNNTRMRRLLGLRGSAAHPALAPQLEGDEVPELLHVEAVVAGAAVAEIGDGARHHVGVEDAGAAKALRREVLVHQGGQLPAQPPGQRDAEALLRALQDLARHELVQHAAQEVLGAQRPAAKAHRQPQRELRQAVVE